MEKLEISLKKLILNNAGKQSHCNNSVALLACETEEICADPTLFEAFAMSRLLQIARNQKIQNLCFAAINLVIILQRHHAAAGR